ncbi:MAG: ATP-binding protein [Myxacorys californica WJT36-NPBG1]|jgi:hypothetical protein|nr:ATP-binding protein [Myxacorys californica WJT36-NPBG1]
MISRPFDSIGKDDIESLISNNIPESRTLEYKEALPGNADDDKREFLADVSSFANASGGTLIYGVREQRDGSGKTTGFPESIVGLGNINIDAEKLRLESILQAGISRRIIGLQIKAIDGFSSGEVLLIQVPPSWNSPHMVTFKNWSRFFSRNSAGKYQLDVDELRNAFIASESLGEQIRQFRVDRVAKLIEGEGPTKLLPGAKFMLHLIPVATFGSSEQVDVRAVFRANNLYSPGEVTRRDRRFNLDGVLSFVDNYTRDNESYSYAQLFRNGAIEAACSLMKGDDTHVIEKDYELKVLKSLDKYLHLLQELSINSPIIISLTMIGVKGYKVGRSIFDASPYTARIIDRDVLIIPEISLEEYGVVLENAMRPSFDAVWQASGGEGSPNYDQAGKWIGSLDT